MTGAEQPLSFDDLSPLLAAVCDGTIDADNFARLQGWLASDPAARQAYIAYMDLHGNLFWDHQQKPLDNHSSAALEDPFAVVPQIVITPSSQSLSSYFDLHSPVGGFVFSHIAAAVILGIGLLIGLAWRISLPVEGNSHRQSPNIAPNHLRQESPPTVARITALADCKWTKQGPGVRDSGSGISNRQIPKFLNPQIPIFPGDRFILSAGLMQITYDTGAKVLLQGPCTYEIDSARSGYLAIGKLTALVEKKAEESNPQPLAPSPLFSVRTPTAVVTDLGTEFGVEVEESGATRSHVFQGSVELRVSNSRRSTTSGKPVKVLHAGQSAHVKRTRNNKVIITREPGQSSRFAREISKSPNQQISNYRPLAPHYHLTDLGTLGGARSTAQYLNAHGQVVGWAEISTGVPHAFLYDNGAMKDLGVLADNASSGALGINANGVVVGDVGRGDKRRAFMYVNDKMHILPSLGGNDTIAQAVNDSGTVVGVSRNAAGIERAFIYTQTEGVKDLGALGGPQARSSANHINPAGMVVGASETSQGPTKAFLYTPDAGMKALGDFGGDCGEGYKINNAGQIVGYATDREGRRQAFFYNERKGMKKLSNSKGDESIAMDINNASEIVGFFSHVNLKGVPTHAFICRQGEITDLNSLIDPTDGWTLLSAMAINDAGQIVGFGQSSFGDVRAFLLTPVREGRGAAGERQGIH